MTDAERAAHAREAFARLLAKFLDLTDAEHSGSFTVHYSRHRVRSVEWRKVEDLGRRGDAA